MNTTLRTTSRGKLRAADVRAFLAALDAHAARHPRPSRYVDSAEGRTFVDAVNEAPMARRVRIYSHAGFVANCYRFPCPIEWVEGVRDGAVWVVTVGRGDAKRSGGRGTTVVVVR